MVSAVNKIDPVTAWRWQRQGEEEVGSLDKVVRDGLDTEGVTRMRSQPCKDPREEL